MTSSNPGPASGRPTDRGMRITEGAHADLTALTFDMSAKLRRRLSLSDVLSAAVRIARAHPDETESELSKP